MTESEMKPAPGRRTTEKQPDGEDFKEVVNLMAVGSEAAAQLEAIKAEIDAAYLELVDEFKAPWAKLQATLAQAEAAMEVYCRTHPEWFKAVKSIKTPFGKVAFRAGTSLVVKDEEATVRLIEAVFAPEAGQYIHQQKVPNLEALEKLDDAELKRVMVKRVAADVFKFTPAEVDLGTAAKEKLPDASLN